MKNSIFVLRCKSCGDLLADVFMEGGAPIAEIRELTYHMNPDGTAIPKAPTPTRIRFMDDANGGGSYSIYSLKCRCGTHQLGTGELIGHFDSGTSGKVLI